MGIAVLSLSVSGLWRSALEQGYTATPMLPSIEKVFLDFICKEVAKSYCHQLGKSKVMATERLTEIFCVEPSVMDCETLRYVQTGDHNNMSRRFQIHYQTEVTTTSSASP